MYDHKVESECYRYSGNNDNNDNNDNDSVDELITSLG